MRVNSLQWYYSPGLGIVGDTIELEGDEWHHAHHVVRMKAGDQMILCDGMGTCMEAEIHTANPKQGKLVITKDVSGHFINPRNYKVSVGLAPTKNIDRIEFAIEKMVEIGVDEIFLLDCEHNERTHLRIDRMQKIITSAAKQSRKSVFPLIHDKVTPKACVEIKKKNEDELQVFACHLDEKSLPLSKNYSPGKNVLMLTGPEGGFSLKELESMATQNVKFVHLGPFRLRAETAAVVACAAIHTINQT